MLRRKPIGALLVEDGVVTPEQLQQALDRQAETGRRVGEILVQMGACTSGAVMRHVAGQLGLPYVETLDLDEIDEKLSSGLTMSWAKRHGVLPLRRAELGAVVVATSDPLNTFALDDLQAMFQAPIELVVVAEGPLNDAINKVFDRLATADEILKQMGEGDDAEDADSLLDNLDILDTGDDAPIIRLVNSLLNQALKEGASDIHIEPFERHVSIRFRKDGVLHEVTRAPKSAQAPLTSRIKIMGELNIAEKRLPQDGRIRIKVGGRDVDIRLSTVPTAHGERLVLRLLDKTTTVLDLEQLGFSADNLRIFEQLIRHPHGIILVTGPTGSGKTTTLYAALSRINSPDKNILTIEDPIEYQIEGIGQMQVNPKINFTFASGLRAILRQDPDVVLVGEIRDRETAEIAVQASLTGHLVFSTVHTNDSASTFTRLIDMGVEPFLIASSVLACMAQRLVRRLCMQCREPYEMTDNELDQMRMASFEGRFDELLAQRYGDRRPVAYRAVGCPACGRTGYSGRTAIYELLVVNEHIRPLIVREVSSTDIKRAAVGDGMRTLVEDGFLKVFDGQTTLEEVFRVAMSADEVV